MDFNEIRKNVIIAIFSDDQFMEQLVLKGGNAISLVHRLDYRKSLDLDFSMSGDFQNLEETSQRLFTALRRHFEALSFVVFDEKLTAKPHIDGEDLRPWWGGYELNFKLIGVEKYHRLKERPDKMSSDALVINANQERTFGIDFSKYEYTDPKILVDFESYSIPVYTLEMIAVEKLRALCQQLPEYEIKGRGKRRARDFYDIHLIETNGQLDLGSPENQKLLINIFEAKRVHLSLLGKIETQREFHREDWPAVINAIGKDDLGFDFYFDHTLKIIERLKPLWDVQPPV